MVSGKDTLIEGKKNILMSFKKSSQISLLISSSFFLPEIEYCFIESSSIFLGLNSFLIE